MHYTKEQMEHRRDGVHHSRATKRVCEDWLELHAEVEQLWDSMRLAKMDSGEIEDQLRALVDAATVVVDEWDCDEWNSVAMLLAMTGLRVVAGIKAPPIDDDGGEATAHERKLDLIDEEHHADTN